MCLSDDRLRGGALTLIPYAIEDGGRTSRQGQQAWLRQLAAVRAAASGRVRLSRSILLAVWHITPALAPVLP